jgi:hypothetical protein
MFMGQQSTVSRNAAKAGWCFYTNCPPSWRHRGVPSFVLVARPHCPTDPSKVLEISAKPTGALVVYEAHPEKHVAASWDLSLRRGGVDF